MLHVVSFSSGLSSAVCTDRVLARYGKKNTEIVFMDTKFEDEDNYRFLEDCERYWQHPIIILQEGRNPYQVSKDKQIIPNQKIAPCTFTLKIALFTNALLRKDVDDITIHIGYDFFEIHRCERTEKSYNEYGWGVDFPLLWEPFITKPYSEVVKGWGIEPPRMYAMGYTHANCGGCCVKQGQGDWLRTLFNFPDRFKQAELWEQEMRKHPIRKNYALLRSQRNGVMKPLTLKELRERYENGTVTKSVLKKLDIKYGIGCGACGIGLPDKLVQPSLFTNLKPKKKISPNSS